MKKLESKVVLVTGASKGIGAEIAKSMAKEGAKVIVNYKTDKTGAEKVVSSIEQVEGKAIAVRADITKKKDVETLFAASQEAFGEITTLINNAGVYKFEPVEAITEELFQEHFSTNVLGAFLVVQEALKSFSSGGSIINISSIATVKPTPMTALYSATKGALDAATQVLAQELGAKNIRVNAVLPGPTQTEGNQMSEDVKTYVETNTPLGRIGITADVAGVAVFLASDEASFISGQKIGVSGGF
ncbi:SDR family NAD(P)-dependent oxidoreductase [Seonamhaeicola sp. ML3]|uniref:SDR family NAD(P)-dependent oxidoreductase n=1 Tax=Seonamhaeicola sp. ML3 TaxID=2937786 RepID=UPI00200E84C2|nr:glucose 1-dehydrogenase [Seonamhaeicola sp. ML3]